MREQLIAMTRAYIIRTRQVGGYRRVLGAWGDDHDKELADEINRCMAYLENLREEEYNDRYAQVHVEYEGRTHTVSG